MNALDLTPLVIVLALLVRVGWLKSEVAMLKMNVAELTRMLIEVQDEKIRQDSQTREARAAEDQAWLETVPEDHRAEAVRAVLIERGILPLPAPPAPDELPNGPYL